MSIVAALPAKLPVTTWCCEHGRAQSPMVDQMNELLKQLPTKLGDTVDSMMM
jgi:hypothetical protein